MRASSPRSSTAPSATRTARRWRASGSPTRARWLSWPHDGERLWLVRQPREAVGEPDLLELPAGKFDVQGEAPLATAKRELAEEIGKAAEHWEPLKTLYTSAGFTDETIELWLATGLSDASAETEEDERIEIVTHPLAELDDVIAQVKHAKTLVGLLLLGQRLRG